MMKKWRYTIAACMLPLAMLAGCGDGTGTGIGEESSANIADEVAPVDMTELTEETPSPEPEETPEPETALLYHTGTLTPEEEAALLETMTTLHQNLELPEYLGEGIHMISTQGWLDDMCGGIYEGARSYSLLKGEDTLLTVQIGFDIAGKPYINVFCPGEDGSVLVLKQEGKTTWLLQAKVSEGKYDGAFESWLFDGESGHIEREQGTYAAGIIVGEYKKSEYTGSAGEAFDMWTNRENFEYKVTTVTYDENGEVAPTPTPTPTATPKPPVQTQAPAPQPTPEPTPEPPAQNPNPPAPPAPPAQTPQPTPQPTPEPTPQPTPEPPPEPSMGGDSDIDWSPDI